jgi:hypothetical protein
MLLCAPILDAMCFSAKSRECVEISGEQVTGSPKIAITELWGEQVAQAMYDRWGVVSKEKFHSSTGRAWSA